MEDSNASDLQLSDLCSPRALPAIRDRVQGIQQLLFNVAAWDTYPKGLGILGYILTKEIKV